MTVLTIDRRFCGPPESGNGGYVCGLVAGLADRTVTVRLLMPPPLQTPLQVVRREDGTIEVMHGESVVVRAYPAELNLEAPPAPPTHIEAVAASRHCPGFVAHPFPTCFVCGPQRARGDGLRIFPGPLAGRDGIVAAPWVPDASLDRGDGKVRPEFMWAALDCPGFFAVNPHVKPMLLGEFTAHEDRCVHVGESCTVVGWKIGSSGRKHEAGTALFDDDGELCGKARALWIEPRT